MATNLTPSFKRPPVIERVLGIQFAPIEKWGVPHYGLFWKTIRADFPEFDVCPPIATMLEGKGQESPILEMFNPGDVRCWFVSPLGDKLIQVQRDRFLLNWRRRPDAGEYPRYTDNLKHHFGRWWAAFRAFLEKEKLKVPTVVQCEVTYINHIPQGEGWETAADWHSVFTVCNKLSSDGFLPPPESRRFNLHYPMSNGLGSLKVNVTRAVRKEDSKNIIQFELIARGCPEQRTTEAITGWMDNAHDWIVSAFSELTTDAMHTRWGKES